MKKLRSIVVGIFLVLAAAVPGFAVDGYFSGPSLCTGSSNQAVKIYGNHVIVDCNGSYVLHDIEKNTSTQLPSAYYYKMSGNIIIYRDRNDGTKLNKYIISTGEITTIRGSAPPNVWYSPDASIDGNRVVWVYEDDNTWVRGIQVHDIATGQTTAIITDTLIFARVSIHGDRLIYTKGGALYMYDLIENRETPLGLSLGSNYYLFEIDSKYVYVQESAYVIKTYEIATGIVDTVSADLYGAYAPTVHDGKLYFADNNGSPYYWQVYQ